MLSYSFRFLHSFSLERNVGPWPPNGGQRLWSIVFWESVACRLAKFLELRLFLNFQKIEPLSMYFENKNERSLRLTIGLALSRMESTRTNLASWSSVVAQDSWCQRFQRLQFSEGVAKKKEKYICYQWRVKFGPQHFLVRLMATDQVFCSTAPPRALANGRLARKRIIVQLCL